MWNSRCPCEKRKYGKAYNSWRGMIERCSNPKHDFFHIYGARGISVCERWLSYDNFFKDMGNCPNGMQLDRVENNGNYEPSNCRWATYQEQATNKTNNRHLLCFGKSIVMSNAAERIGITQQHLRSVMQRAKWPDIDVGILPKTNITTFLSKWLRGSCRIEFAP